MQFRQLCQNFVDKRPKSFNPISEKKKNFFEKTSLAQNVLMDTWNAVLNKWMKSFQSMSKDERKSIFYEKNFSQKFLRAARDAWNAVFTTLPEKFRKTAKKFLLKIRKKLKKTLLPNKNYFTK